MNLFKLHDTHGLPLDISVMIMAERGLTPNFDEFVLAAKAKGWSDRKIRATVSEAASDYGRETQNGIMTRVELTLKEPSNAR